MIADEQLSMAIWVHPDSCFPPHRVTHPAKVASLAKDFEDFGWWGEALVGYFTWDQTSKSFGLQLLSGSHRWAAALEVGTKIPVVILDEDEVESAWGDLTKWNAIMAKGSEVEYCVRY